MEFFTSLFRGSIGIFVLLGICYFLSTSRQNINWKTVVYGLLLQVVLALLLLKVPFVRDLFGIFVKFFSVMISASEQSAQFLFGSLADPTKGYGFAFTALPTILFFSAISSVLYYLGVLQKIVFGFAWLMKKTMYLSGAESLAAAANVFMGQTEAPLVVKPYLEKMTRSEVLCLMTGGMATIAGSVFGLYMAMLGGTEEAARQEFGMHLLTASIISAPAAIITAKMLFPETQPEVVEKTIHIPKSEAGKNLLDALSTGTTDGLKLAVNVAAMLFAFMAFIYFSNIIFMKIGDWFNFNDAIASSSNGLFKGFTMEYILGWLFAPIAWLIGVEGSDLLAMGRLLGEKTILNEFVSYASLVELKQTGLLSNKTVIIATYALCGFANFASIGIQIGGISAIAPGQRNTLTEFGVKALVGGTVACLITGALAGILVA